MKKYLVILIAVLMVFTLAACGGSSSDTSSEESSDKQAETAEAEEEKEEPAEEVHPYAWLGLEDMPECEYLDILATNHYIRKFDEYIDGLSYVDERIEAADGLDTFKEDKYNKIYVIDGKTTVINKDAKTYVENDLGGLTDAAEDTTKEAMEKGTNISGRAFREKGKGAVPVQTDDKDEYEYYEYNYPDFEKDSENSETERFYMKEGDVYAIYKKITMGETVVETTEMIKKISGDIPDDTFKLPDLSDYKKND